MLNWCGKKNRESKERLSRDRAAIAAPVYFRDLTYWIATTPPEPASAPWCLASNNTACNWVVSSQGSQAHVDLYDITPTQVLLPTQLPSWASSGGCTCAHPIGNDWILGYKNGLAWSSHDGQRAYSISHVAVSAFIQTSLGLLAFAASESNSEKGQILLLRKNAQNAPWRAEALVDLPRRPCAASLYTKDSLLILNEDQLVMMDSAGNARIIVNNAFWNGLSPNSVVSTFSGIYIGMQHGVARVTGEVTIPSLDWLLPNQIILDASARG